MVPHRVVHLLSNAQRWMEATERVLGDEGHTITTDGSHRRIQRGHQVQVTEGQGPRREAPRGPNRAANKRAPSGSSRYPTPPQVRRFLRIYVETYSANGYEIDAATEDERYTQIPPLVVGASRGTRSQLGPLSRGTHPR